MPKAQDNFYSLSPKAILIWCAFSWIFSTLVTFLLNWVPFEEMHVSKKILYIMLTIGSCVSIFIFVLSFFIERTGIRIPSNKNIRVITMAVFVAFSVIPLSFIFVLLGLDYYFLVPIRSYFDLIFRILVWFLILSWCVFQLKNYRKRIIDNRFIEKEFIVFDDKIIFRRPYKTSLDAPAVNGKYLFPRIYNKYGSYLFIVIFCGYPLQRIFMDISGVAGVLLFTAILSIPLNAWIFKQLVCAFYLYIYTVLRLERKHGKPVFYS